MAKSEDEGESVLDGTQRQYLAGLAHDPVWQSILAVLGRAYIMPNFRRSDDPHRQFYSWVYASGRCDDREQMIRVLTNGKYGLGQIPAPFIDREDE